MSCPKPIAFGKDAGSIKVLGDSIDDGTNSNANANASTHTVPIKNFSLTTYTW